MLEPAAFGIWINTTPASRKSRVLRRTNMSWRRFSGRLALVCCNRRRKKPPFSKQKFQSSHCRAGTAPQKQVRAFAAWQKMADTEGFEPSKPLTKLASLAGRWFQPLTHVSAFIGRSPGCSRGYSDGNAGLQRLIPCFAARPVSSKAEQKLNSWALPSDSIRRK